MPTSYKSGKKEVKEYLLANFGPAIRVLDVGPGEGTYQELLGQHFKRMDACEIYAPYISKYQLESKYGKVFNQSVVDFANFEDYDLVIMGDILEHLTVQQAQDVIARIPGSLLVAVPFEYVQGGSHGNEAERHLQDDLTPENFEERYPGFQKIYMKSRSARSVKKGKGEYSYGYYIRKK